MSTYREDVKRVQAMNDEVLLATWEIMGQQPDRNIYGDWWTDTRPSEDWAEAVYGELSDRGLMNSYNILPEKSGG